MSRATIINYYEPSLLTNAERKHQTVLVMKLFELWKLTYKQQAIALGLSANTESSIHNYKSGKHPLPQLRDIQDRIRLLLTIHKYLRRAYPYNKELAYLWITTPNLDFDHLSPFDIIFRDGYLGLVKIKNYLEINQLS